MYLKYVGFERLTAVVMKNTVFWDITPCSPLKVNLKFHTNIARIVGEQEIA
jgi:hypothetical protein